MRVMMTRLSLSLVFLLCLVAGRTRSSTDDQNKTACSIKHSGRNLTEGQSLEILGKIHKVERCSLQRAFHACGTHLVHMLNILCQMIDNDSKRQKSKQSRRFVRAKSLSDACCLSVCTINEMSRYCRWVNNNKNSVRRFNGNQKKIRRSFLFESIESIRKQMFDHRDKHCSDRNKSRSTNRARFTP